MIITFEIEGVPQQIKWDNYCFHALNPNGSNAALGYYKKLGGAVAKLVKHHFFSKNDIVNGFESQVHIKDFAEQFDLQVKTLFAIENIEELNPNVFTVTEKEKEVKVLSEETKAKMKASKAAKKELENNIPIEEDDDDGL